MNETLRELAICLLDNDDGISRRTWRHLHELLRDSGSNQDILSNVETRNNRWYLSESWEENDA
jgi:hypothetical protein